ncbi:malate synthase [Plesiocystis pacifica SIR-1]|uniref:Malate synthase n=1 Tax=Plesiocystis pacifica SIR-1 TaxID=391625 RepID=A6GIB0_9BACT|nr:malate synthase A [Plesiocystis pacifica]EDM74412.1 malate synthase [Plesiocystis pacifica SIR-1]
MMLATQRGLAVLGPEVPGSDLILTDEALEFVGALCAEFQPRIEALLARRRELQSAYDAGERPRFLTDTAEVRAGSWRVASIPADLERRTVEITGPVEPKMIINALNSGADVFMADFEDASAPSWANMIGGQLALFQAVRGGLEYVDLTRGRHYQLDALDSLATLMVRPRGLHLREAQLELAPGRPAAASLVDFGLYFFHNAKALLERGSGPYFYLPKLQSHLEARLWNQVFGFAQRRLGIAHGTIRATVLIETLPAAFEMDEILYELREHSAGLNCGRWDYIFSAIKTFRRDPSWVLPDRAEVGMTQPFMRAYTQLLIQTCHRRGAHAMGGMAALIPRKDDPAANAAALAKVREGKLREARDGHDGTWVAHPGLIPIAREAFQSVTDAPNQLGVLREDVRVEAADLCAPPEGARTEAGVRTNVRVGVQYLEAWLRGRGCVPLNFLMEDAATAEISRAQLWQWRAHGARLDDGRVVDEALLRTIVAEELDALRAATPAAGASPSRLDLAERLFTQMVLADELADFLTLEAYPHL